MENSDFQWLSFQTTDQFDDILDLLSTSISKVLPNSSPKFPLSRSICAESMQPSTASDNLTKKDKYDVALSREFLQTASK